MSEAMWSQDQAVALECAHEVISDLIAIRMAEIYGEEAKGSPNLPRIAALREHVAGLWGERADLKVTDDAAVAAVRANYGQLVRTHRANAKQAA
jgi:hypothetical protein